MGQSVPKPTMKEQMRQNVRQIDRACRELERERKSLERSQVKLQADIRAAVSKGQTSSARIMARDYVRSKKYVEKFYGMRTQLQGVKLQMQAVKSQHAMAEAMKVTTKSMVSMGKAMKMPQLQKIIRDFAVQSERMEMTGEVMGDAIDMAMEGSDDEEDEEEMLKSVEAELGLSLMAEAPSVGAVAAEGAKAPAAAVAAPIGAAAGGGGGGAPPPGGAGGPPPAGGGAAGGSGGGASGGGGGGGGMSDLEARLANLRS